MIKLEGYQTLIVGNRQQESGGGCLFFVSEQIQVEKLHLDWDIKSFEMIGITISNKISKTRLINIYRPPANSATCFLDKIE